MTTYLITGGTGSLGSILSRKIFEGGNKVRAMSRSESRLAEMKNLYPEKQFTGIYGDIRDYTRVNFSMRGVDYVIHTAAMKNLYITEHNVPELNQTNIQGTQNIVFSAIEQGVKKAIFISSDKAVNPSSAYGASKRTGEWLWYWGGDITQDSDFIIVRSGNFLESAGNVFEIWKKQALEKKPLTVTDARMKRHFIQTEKLADIVLDTVYNCKNGDLVVPKMNEYLMLDLLKERFPCSDYVVTGLRPGEKLTEELTYEDETLVKETPDYLVYRKGAK